MKNLLNATLANGTETVGSLATYALEKAGLSSRNIIGCKTTDEAGTYLVLLDKEAISYLSRYDIINSIDIECGINGVNVSCPWSRIQGAHRPYVGGYVDMQTDYSKVIDNLAKVKYGKSTSKTRRLVRRASL